MGEGEERREKEDKEPAGNKMRRALEQASNNPVVNTTNRKESSCLTSDFPLLE